MALAHGCVYVDVCVCSGPDEIPTPSEPIEPLETDCVLTSLLFCCCLLSFSGSLLLRIPPGVVITPASISSHSRVFRFFGLSQVLIAVVDNDIKIVDMGPVPLSTPSNVYFISLLNVYLFISFMCYFCSPIKIESKTTAG